MQQELKNNKNLQINSVILFITALFVGAVMGYIFFKATSVNDYVDNQDTVTPTNTVNNSVDGDVTTNTVIVPTNNADIETVTTFEECVALGFPVQESYPRVCITNGQRFVEEIGNVFEVQDLIQLESVRANQVIESSLKVTGRARGTWFFEGTFPVILTDWDGLIIAETYATTTDDWMTEDFIRFSATLEFDTPAYGERGSLILHKSNPSGLPQHDNALEIPVKYSNQ